MENGRILVFLASVILVFVSYCEACTFPDFVQSNGTMKDWKSKIRGQGAEISLKMQFEGGTLTAVATDSRAKSYSRICIQVYHGDRFLVAHEEKGQRQGKYTCMMFVERGDGVMQIMAADLSSRMNRNLCTDSKLKLQEWLIIDWFSALDNEELCSLKGGWDITQFDKGTMKAVCDGYEGETRIESECQAGDSLNFYFRRQGCVSEEQYMYATQKTICLANWAEGVWNFILLKHDYRDYMWVLRYPVDPGDRFTSYLFRDIFAPIELSSYSRNYMHIAMQRKPESSRMPLCYDDYEICSVIGNPCTHNEKMAITCSKTCNICNSTVPVESALNSNFQGRWAEAGRPERTSMVVEGASVTFPHVESFKHLSWGARSGLSSEALNGIREIMFVSKTERGCRPRYSCARIIQVTPSVMFIHISMWQFWPLIDNPSKKVDCSSFRYNVEKNINKYRGKTSRLLMSRSINVTVQCDLGSFERFDVVFQDGVRCSGHITQPESKDSVNFTLPGCQANRLADTFTCIEYARYAPTNDFLLVSRSSSSPEEIHCWIFPKRPTNIFYFIPASQCNELSKKRIRKGRLVPIATFTRERRRPPMHTKTIMVENTVELAELEQQRNDTIQITYREEPRQTSPTNMTFIDKEDEISLDNGNITSVNYDDVTEVDDDSHPNPLVITALVITMVAVQLSLLCACKC